MPLLGLSQNLDTLKLNAILWEFERHTQVFTRPSRPLRVKVTVRDPLHQ